MNHPSGRFILIATLLILTQGVPAKATVRGDVPDLAAAGTWESIGPYGGHITGLARNPSNPKEIYAAVNSDPGQLYRSVDSGSTWKRIHIFRSQIHDVALHPLSPKSIYVLGMYSFYRSTDGGATFLETDFRGIFSGYYGRIALHPKNPDRIYLAGSNTYEWDHWYGCSAVNISSDGGKTWALKRLDSPPVGEYAYTYGLAVSPVNPNVIFACGLYYKTPEEIDRVYKSLDAGKTWKNATGAINSAPNAVAVHPRDLKKVYVATEEGVFRSSDCGSTWTKQASPVEMPVAELAFDPANPSILYAAGNRADEPALYKSTDGGVKWKTLTKGLYGAGRRLLSTSGALYFGSTAGLFKSTNGGLSFAAGAKGMKAAEIVTLAVAPSSPGVIYVGQTHYGLLKSADGGKTWTKLPDFDGSARIRKIAVHPVDANTVFVLASPGNAGDVLFKSADGGKHMTAVLPAPCEGLFINPLNPDHLFAAGSVESGSGRHMALHKSVDGGAGWSTTEVTAASDSGGKRVVADPANDAVIYVGGYKTGYAGALFKTLNGGSSWFETRGSIKGVIWALAVDPLSPNILYASAQNLYRSANSGASWARVADGGIMTIKINPSNPSEVFAGGGYDGKGPIGVLTSLNRGATWQSLSLGLIVKTVTEVDLNSADRILYAATRGAGICRRKLQ